MRKGITAVCVLALVGCGAPVDPMVRSTSPTYSGVVKDVSDTPSRILKQFTLHGVDRRFVCLKEKDHDCADVQDGDLVVIVQHSAHEHGRDTLVYSIDIRS